MTAWRDRAACLGLDVNMFYPERGDATEEARAICHGCPVREDCLDWALRHEPDFGIWGGVGAVARGRIRGRAHRYTRPDGAVA